MTDSPESTVNPNTRGSGSARGRPTKYDPEMCERVIELGKDLASLAPQSRVELDVCLASLSDGKKNTRNLQVPWSGPDSSPSIGGRQAGEEGMLAGPGSFNAAIWSRSMAARFPETWREKRIRVEIPDVVDNSTLIQAQASVSAAIAKGKLDTDGGTVSVKTPDRPWHVDGASRNREAAAGLEEKLRVRT